MASPVPVASMGGPWNGRDAQHQQLPPPQRSQQQYSMPPQAEADEPGVQVRPMGLKVHYTFDKDGKVNCLARFSQTLQVQTIPICEATIIGIIDLRPCIHAVMECSPELAGQETDYTIYALDFSEPDTPLVGQGMLSWALESMRNESMMQQPKMVTGRVTKNLLGVFGGGNRETLEVRLRLSAAPRSNRQIHHSGLDIPQHGPVENIMTPTGTLEWESFMQSNPHIGEIRPQINNTSRVASPATLQGQDHQHSMTIGRDTVGPMQQPQQRQQRTQQQMPDQMQEPAVSAQEPQRVSPTLIDPSEQQTEGAPAPSSRPSSRASKRAPRRRQPTGRPRGRPRKKAAEGNTSGYDDGTEGEDAGPTKKRIKTTVVERASPNPFASGPESLRVAASTSGSLRNFRPVLANADAPSGNNSHHQEAPRAPTPVPNDLSRGPQGRGPGLVSKLRRESTLSQQPLANSTSLTDSRQQPLSPSQEDGPSPDSLAPTPAYPEDSPADIGSSPPVQRTMSFIRSSPPPSSPVLPPMPLNEPLRDANLATDELDDLFVDEPPQAAPQQPKRPRARRGRGKPTQIQNAGGIPVQVFKMKDGPCGQDLVHVHSYNTPQPNSTPAPVYSDSQFLPSLEMPATAVAAEKSRELARPPGMPATPPPTTDALEKPASPVPTVETATETAPEENMEDAGQMTATVPSPAAAPEENMEDARQMTATVPSPAVAPEENMEDARQMTATIPSPAIAPELPIEPLLSAVIENKNAGEQGRKIVEKAPTPVPPADATASRQMVRSQSAGPLVLPAIPASEPAGPSPLSQAVAAEPTFQTPPAPSMLKRAASSGPLTLPIPASDPVVPTADASVEALLESLVAKSDAIPPPASPPVVTRSNKNHVKRHAIKQRLEEAVMNGEMPPYCCNCGAIETPTWRKIWVQEKEGVPEYCEYSVEPGRVTAIEILRRDADEKPTLHRLVKKSLGGDDDKTQWQELLLCNPCGIWLTKCKSHRPQDRWDKDASRLGQERKKRRGSGRTAPRPKRSRAKSGGAANPTSEAYLPTDALGPAEPSSPKQREAVASENRQAGSMARRDAPARLDAQEARSDPGSTHSRASRGSGTAQSPIDVEFDEAVGSTKRLLFPSPRKEGVLKTLGEVHINIVQTLDESHPPKTGDKENSAATSTESRGSLNDDLEALFKSPTVDRPCTPPPKAKAGTSKEPLKTPTQSAPNHRPITRSISRSIRSIRSAASPGDSMRLLQRTPTKTPRVAFGLPGSANRRRSPRNHQGEFEVFDTPISRTINQIFSDGPGFGENDLYLSNLPSLDGNGSGLIDFGNFLSTDALAPSSPPRDGSLSFDYLASTSAWASWDLDTKIDPKCLDSNDMSAG